MWRSTITFVNARVHTPAGTAHSVRFGGHVLGINEPPGRHDVVIDLDGAHVLPGLINAHDHLELNHYGRLRPSERYANVSEWVDDMRARLRDDPEIRTGQQHRLANRLFAGALKNLLSGVTTVAHHNPLYREIGRFSPIRVLRHFGWAHSFAMEEQPVGARGEPGGNVVARHSATPTAWPFMVHVAEGVDAAAHRDFTQLVERGCLTANAVLIHAVALGEGDWRQVSSAGGAVVWCPASNLFLFERTLDVGRLMCDARLKYRVALATDSRISGSRDLLEEIRTAGLQAGVTSDDLLRMVTSSAADALRLDSAGRIATGQPADLIVLPPTADSAAAALTRAARRDVTLVMVGGRPLIGASSFAPVFRERRVDTRTLVVDEAVRLVDTAVARRIERSSIREAGVELLPERTRDYALVMSR